MKQFDWGKYLNYIIIFVVSLIACVFMPMLGSEIGLTFKLPNTTSGWFVFVFTKIMVATINILLFYCFLEQAEVNVQENENYKKAREILDNKKDEREPRSPKSWKKKQYSVKGVIIFLTSILSALSLTSAVLMFDLVQLLTYLFTIVMGVIFGVISMKSAEKYWTQEYYNYAILIQKGEIENGNRN